MSSRTRILIADMPQMLGNIVQDVVRRQPDFRLLTCPVRLAWPWRRVEPDVVISSRRELMSEATVAAYLKGWPKSRVLLIEPSGRRSVLYELLPKATVLGELSPEQLVEALRQGLTGGGEPEMPINRSAEKA